MIALSALSIGVGLVFLSGAWAAAEIDEREAAMVAFLTGAVFLLLGLKGCA